MGARLVLGADAREGGAAGAVLPRTPEERKRPCPSPAASLNLGVMAPTPFGRQGRELPAPETASGLRLSQRRGGKRAQPSAWKPSRSCAGQPGGLQQRCSAWAPGTCWEAELDFPVGFFNPVKELHSAFLVEDESSSPSPVTEPVSQLLPLASSVPRIASGGRDVLALPPPPAGACTRDQ